MKGAEVNPRNPTHRLAAGGTRIDRAQRLDFTFDGRQLQGCQGDTLASALLANGIDIVARSFKYGRRRGVVGAGAEEPNAIVTVGTGSERTPNLRATQVELYDGLTATSSAASQGFAQRFAGMCKRLLPAGFYYKTFIAPRALWPFWEARLRHAAGLGVAPDGADADSYDKVNQHVDVLVVGGGPAGLAAALAAARAGARVMLADEQAELGGSLLATTLRIDGQSAGQWLDRAVAELRSFADVQLLPRSTAFGYYDHNLLAVLERCTDHLPPAARRGPRQRLHRVRAKQTVLATGAIERAPVFADNDLPGIMLASAISTYINRYDINRYGINRYGVAGGRRLVLFTNNDGAYRAALDWQRAGCAVVAVVDVRSSPNGALPQEARAAGVEVIAGSGVVGALGRRRVEAALVAPLSAGGQQRPNPGAGMSVAGPVRRISCDAIACSSGWSPTVHLSSQAGAKPVWSDEALAFLPGESRQQTRCAGAAQGTMTLADCLREGAEAGAAAAALAGFENAPGDPASFVTDELPLAASQALFLVPHPKPVSRAPPQFVDYQLDVTAADIELAVREGYRSVEHVKRYTALGFGTDQGKLGNVNGVAIMANALGASIAETGTTVFRPAYTPVAFGAMAGPDTGLLFDPERRTPMHDWHGARGAAWENVGRWKRPWYYPRAGESMQDAVARECLAARSGVAMLDASTLGKVDLQGRDVGAFLDRIYTGGFLKLGVGRCRYGLMLREDGTIFDDGVAARLSANRYLIHTTTGNAEAVLSWLELWRQTEWPELDVYCTSVTDHWATAALVGPRARAVLAKVCEDVDLSARAFPFMSVREGRVAGQPARLFRISFSGELSFEINVAAPAGQRVWDALFDAGEEFGMTPYGTETMHVLRAEKGFIIVGQDTDGSVTPDDMGLSWAVRRGKAFGFLGDRSLDLPDHRRSDRPQFVGLETLDGATVLPEGAQIVRESAPMQPGPKMLAKAFAARSVARPMAQPMDGYVTSSYFSAALRRPIALAMVKSGRQRRGEIVHCPLTDGRVAVARIVDPVFYDPAGDRQRV